MKTSRSILLIPYMIWVSLIFISFMFVYLPGIVLPFLFGYQGGRLSHFFAKAWSWTFSRLCAIRYRISGDENIDRSKAYIYVSNHTSYLDIPGTFLAIPTSFRTLAKKELKKAPVFGWIVESLSIVIDRSSEHSRKESIRYMKKILELGISLLVFPEGTQNRSGEVLQRFYDGAFYIAIATQHPIIPIAIRNAGKLMPPSKIHISPGTINIIIGKEIDTTGMKLSDIATLKQKVYGTIKDILLHEHTTPRV